MDWKHHIRLAVNRDGVVVSSSHVYSHKFSVNAFP